MKIIALADITADQRAQPRCAIDVEKVGEYTEDMDRGDKFPPLVVFFDGKRHWLADGFHRFYAATASGRKTLACDVHEGGLRDAILFSCGANAAHGLRRTNQDKRRAVAKLLEDKEWSRWSDHEIARHCSVTHPFIGKLRKEMAASLETVSSEDRAFRSKSGTISEMNVTAINAGRSAPPRATVTSLKLDATLIAKSLHEIERHLNLMPSPADAIANFPQDQHYLFPVSRLDEMAAWLTSFAALWRAQIVAKAHERTA